MSARDVSGPTGRRLRRTTVAGAAAIVVAVSGGGAALAATDSSTNGRPGRGGAVSLDAARQRADHRLDAGTRRLAAVRGRLARADALRPADRAHLDAELTALSAALARLRAQVDSAPDRAALGRAVVAARPVRGEGRLLRRQLVQVVAATRAARRAAALAARLPAWQARVDRAGSTDAAAALADLRTRLGALRATARALGATAAAVDVTQASAAGSLSSGTGRLHSLRAEATAVRADEARVRAATGAAATRSP